MRNLKRLAMVLAIGPVITPIRSLTGGLILACLLIVQPVSANPGTTEGVFNHHVAALATGNIEEIMADYHKKAVLILGGTVFEGEDAIRTFFEGVLAACGPTIELVAVPNPVVINQIAYWQWTWPEVIAYGTTTFVIRGGRIRVQTDGLVPISPSCLFPS